ncbi:MAG TPA: hypothetical protein PLX89_13960 [Verrucomicrobiota bacterium]|nr:hypothetical protein [Verrucomicrobiales bacterium]HRI14098.1 hypothetical protein [Verrucomicrobiota bacterium]
MKLDSLLNTLLTAARQETPSDRVPYAFEHRVMARLRESSPVDSLAAWTAGLWRAAFPSLAIAGLLVGADVLIPDRERDVAANDTLEVALVSSADPTPDLW